MREQLTSRVTAAAATAVPAAAYLATVAPTDAVQGNAQRLMYLHVPAVLVAYAAFVLTSGACLRLLRGDRRWEPVALAAVEVGVVALAIGIVTGSLWGRLVWGVWWSWDPRLTSTAVLFVCYLALTVAVHLRGGYRRWIAAASLLGLLIVPVVHFSVVWWRSLHQAPTLLSPGAHPIDPRMGVALLASVVAGALLGLLLVRRRALVLQARREPTTHPVRAEADLGSLESHADGPVRLP